MKHSTLTWSDLSAISVQMLSRLRRDGDKHVLAVGLGIKNFHKRPRQRRQALIFFVSECVPARHLSQRIRMGKRRCVDVFLRRGQRRRRLRLATDVMVLPFARPTVLRLTSSTDSGSAGLIVTWKESGVLQWGLMTVGHVLPDLNQDPGDTGVVISNADGTEFQDGDFQQIAEQSDPFDVGLVLISQETAWGFAPALANVPDPLPVQLCTFAAIEAQTNHHHERGHCHTLAGTVPLNVDAAIVGPVQPVAGLKPLKYLIHVSATGGAPQPFQPGRSGSPAVDQDGLGIAMLVAATSPAFAGGYMQALQPAADFVATRVNGGDFRCVAIL